MIINWCKMCEDEIIPVGDKYCQYCIEDHRQMHKIGRCNPRCISCGNKPDAYDIQVMTGRKVNERG